MKKAELYVCREHVVKPEIASNSGNRSITLGNSNVII